ncbi:pyridoxal phosphate-dependent transferase [Microdochium bolleyi]|uniref:Pyridoxal phosphate-dependent transferase n=1 Tax=Microdochium bolleyi TaxID=196109 RepID=A0A136IVV4_9PEZI|nr:pyridoxal phosphate-dependent transferase [Microdochium bolleyi]
MAKNTGHSQLDARLAAILADREVRSQRRRLSTFPPHSVDFSSNSYLSLSLIPEIRHAYLELLKSVPDNIPLFGSGGSRLLDGNSLLSEELERQVAVFHGAPAGLLFNSGFDANAGLFACLPQPGDVVVYDELAHASMHDGMRASRAAVCIPFKHNCVYPEQVKRGQDSTASRKADAPKSLSETLQQLLRSDGEPISAAIRSGERNVFIAVEGVYSMDGDVAPLKDIVACIQRHLQRGNGHLIVDEAHSTGIFGDQGRGLVCELGLEDKVFLRLHTFGKAMGSAGAIVLCSPVTREYLINYARTLVYTTAMPTSCLASIKVTYAFLSNPQFDNVRQKLRWLMRYTHNLLVAICARHANSVNDQPTPSRRPLIRVNPTPPKSPIIPLLTSQPRSLAAFCQQRGLVVRPIVAPTVPEGSERIRICLHAANTEEQVDRLGQAIEEWAVTTTTTTATSEAAAGGHPRDMAVVPSAAQQLIKPSL